MTSYTQTFGGQNINPADLSYLAITLAADTTLVWPLNAPPGSTTVADKIDVTPSGSGFSIIMPDATGGSNGTDALFRNLGASSFTVKTSTGSVIATVGAGEGWLVYLRSNATAAGTWGAIQYGAGTSSADAAALAGLGLLAITTTLNQSCPVATKNANYTLGTNDRAQMIVSTGGAITFSFDSAATLGHSEVTSVEYPPRHAVPEFRHLTEEPSHVDMAIAEASFHQPRQGPLPGSRKPEEHHGFVRGRCLGHAGRFAGVCCDSMTAERGSRSAFTEPRRPRSGPRPSAPGQAWSRTSRRSRRRAGREARRARHPVRSAPVGPA